MGDSLAVLKGSLMAGLGVPFGGGGMVDGLLGVRGFLGGAVSLRRGLAGVERR